METENLIVVSKKVEKCSSQELELLGSKKIINELLESNFFLRKQFGITNDQHQSVTKYILEMQQKINFEHSHDFRHWFKNFRKMLNDEAPSDIPKGEWELILGNTEVLMKSAKAQCKGDPVLFFELCQTLPESLGYIDDRSRVFF